MSEGHPSPNFLRDTSICGACFIAGGTLQAGVEALKIRDGQNLEKFPLGWESYNLAEEFLEGGLPAVTGALAGKFLYHLLIELGAVEYQAEDELFCMFAGAALGYVTMTIIGAVLHEALNVKDVRWLPN